MAQYKRSLVGFYDILGFKEFVRTHRKATDVQAIFRQIREEFSFNKDERAQFKQQFSHFSDTVVRSTPFALADGNANQCGMLFHELLDAAYFQKDLVFHHHIWSRGAIVAGEIYHRNEEVFGPAVIRAYELAETTAVYPRIIVDPQLLAEFEIEEALRSSHQSLEYERESCYNLLSLGDDGLWYVDYLRIAAGELDDPDQFPSMLRTHKEIILEALNKAPPGMNRVTQKFNWLTQYHNRVAREQSEEFLEATGVSRSSILISRQEAPLNFEPPAVDSENV